MVKVYIKAFDGHVAKTLLSTQYKAGNNAAVAQPG